MDNKEIVGEQPEQIEQVQTNVSEKDIGTTTSKDEGSPLGKFTSAESLLEAYNNLQSEFTRKCQRLSELEKKSDNETSSVEVSPIYENEDWNRKVGDFLDKNKEASNFSKEICDEIVNDKSLAEKDDCLELAWQRIKSQRYRAPEEIVKDENFVENYILSNDEIKQKVLDIYIKQISENNAPPIMSSSNRGEINISPKSNPKNLDEARKLVEQILKV